MQVTFLGVRGSTPAPGESTSRYGGHTSCVLVQPEDGPSIILDLGTGVRRLDRGPLSGVVLLTHLHFDHVQGLPFCAGLLHPESELDVYGPRQDDASLDQAFRSFVQPPVFPISLDMLPATLRFHDLDTTPMTIAPGVEIRAAHVPHPGPTFGFRIDADGHSVAYIPDHQEPVAPDVGPTQDVLDLIDGVDLLIHDAQYTHEEFARRSTWGHCTVDFAVDVALAGRVGHLAMFHHDPTHVDSLVDSLVLGAVDRAAGRLGVFGARETATVDLADLTCRPSLGAIVAPVAGRRLT